MATKLTPIAVENAKAKRKGGVLARNEIADRGCPGLYLVVQPSGVKSWAYRYRVDGQSRKLTFGNADMSAPGAISLAAARVAAAQARQQVELGADPANDKRMSRSTTTRTALQAVSAESVEAMVGQFLTIHVRPKTRPASARLTESIFTRFILPTWGDRNVRDIARRDVIALVENIAVAAPVLANRALSALSKFFAWLEARDMISNSPTKGVEKPGVETARDRILDDGELTALWLACSGPDAGVAEAVIRVLMLSGCRKTEIAAARHDELDLEKRTLTIPAARSKNGRVHAVPLPSAAWDIIMAQPRVGPFIFSTTGKGPIKNIDRAKARVDAQVRFDKPWVLHDTRRAVASGMQKLGIRFEVIEAVLNHKSGSLAGVAGIYQRFDFAAEKKAALAKWAEHIERLASGKTANVLPFPATA